MGVKLHSSYSVHVYRGEGGPVNTWARLLRGINTPDPIYRVPRSTPGRGGGGWGDDKNKESGCKKGSDWDHDGPTHVVPERKSSHDTHLKTKMKINTKQKQNSVLQECRLLKAGIDVFCTHL